MLRKKQEYVTVERNKPFPAGYVTGTFGGAYFQPEQTHKSLTVQKATQLIIDYLNLKYVEAKTDKEKFIDGTKKLTKG
jgi:hypothetical protein